MPVTSFFAQASNPGTGTTPRSLLMVRCFLSPGHLGTLVEGDLSSYADAAERCCSYLRHTATPGAVDIVTTLHTQLGKPVSATA